jgi:hypothetical protein
MPDQPIAKVLSRLRKVFAGKAEQSYRDRDAPGTTEKASAAHDVEGRTYAGAEAAIRKEQATNDAADSTDDR